jgi:hypothetical protein
VSISDDTGKFMLIGQLGVLVPINNGPVGLDVGGSFMWKSFSGHVGEGLGVILGVHVGLVFMIGRE